MALPIKISGVHYYKISGKYIFAGDLIVTRGTLYFFPMIDLEEQRTKSTRYLPHQLGLIALALTYLVQKVSASYMSRNDVWVDGISDEQFRKNADAFIEGQKAQRREIGISEVLPVPIRINSNEISNIKLNSTGKLSFLAQSDTHDFNIGLRSKNRVRDAIWEGGLGKV